MFGRTDNPTRIVQEKFWQGARTLEIGEDDFLRVSWKSGLQMQERSINLLGFNLKPLHDKSGDTKILVWACIVLALTVGLFVGCFFAQSEGLPIVIAFTLISGVVDFFIFRNFFKDNRDILKFRNDFSGETFILFYGKPNMPEFEAFVAALKKKIESVRPPTPSMIGIGSISQELQSLAKLRTDGIISEEEFCIAKRRVLGQDETTPPIGFRKE